LPTGILFGMSKRDDSQNVPKNITRAYLGVTHTTGDEQEALCTYRVVEGVKGGERQGWGAQRALGNRKGRGEKTKKLRELDFASEKGDGRTHRGRKESKRVWNGARNRGFRKSLRINSEGGE